MFEKEYASADLIPAEVRHLYKEQGGKFVLLGSTEVKTTTDVANVQEALRKEREDHKESKQKLAAFNGLDPVETQEKLDKIPELEAAAEGKMDEAKISELAEKRVAAKVLPLERKINQLTEANEAATTTIGQLEGDAKQRTIHDAIREAATGSKMVPTAVEDALLHGSNVLTIDESGAVVTKDNVGVTPGVGADVWLSEIKESRSHWWPESQGAGSQGGGAGAGKNNPFTKDNWNMTEQANMYRESPETAEQMAKSAGTTIGGGMPSK